MFRLVRLQPPHGWNAVVWELGIVTLGVLMAIAAQQTVDRFHQQSELREFRQAVRTEISRDLATYTGRKDEDRCILARLDELQRWLDSWRSNRPLKLTGPISIPDSFAIRTGVWDSRDAGLMTYMPLSEKLDYVNLYTEFANNEVHRLDERAAWIELANYNGATALDHQDMIRLQGLISRARLRLERMTGNASRFVKDAAAIGIQPQPGPNWPAIKLNMCRPVLPK